MKKILILTVSLIAIGLLAFALTGCKSIAPISLEDFKEKAVAAEYTAEAVGNRAFAYKGTVDEHEYVIRLIVCETTEQAQSAYSEAEKGLPSGGSSVEVNIPAYNYIKRTSGGKYYVMYRVGVTFLYVEADDAYKTEINDFLKSIGY